MNAVIENVLPKEAGAPAAVVHKFGGSSLADSPAIRQAAARLAEDPAERIFVVVSAARGVTDDLLAAIDAAARGEDWRRRLARLKRRQRRLIRELLPADQWETLFGLLGADFKRLHTLAEAAAVLGVAAPENSDAFAAHGELWSMRLFAALLNSEGLAAETFDARHFLCALREEREVRIDWTESASRFAATVARAPVVVVPGFIATHRDNATTLTLGRNGSDWSATILARLASARAITIWTDVPGVLEADPCVAPEARAHATLDLDVARTAAEHGARVLHPATLAPLAGLDAHLAVRDTFTPGARGTRIMPAGGASDAIIAARPHGQRTTVSAIGAAVNVSRAVAALAGAHFHCSRLEAETGRVSATVETSEAIRVQRLWHRALCRRRRGAALVLIGAGQVGRALLKALAGWQGDGEIRLLALANSRLMHYTAAGIAPAKALAALRGADTATDLPALTEFLLTQCDAAPVIIDATASDEVAAWHSRWLTGGIHVVTANKLAAAAGLAPSRGAALYGDAATLGAGLPVLATLRRLRAAGDRILRIEGIVSGSLGYLFHALERGRGFSAALKSACRAGYTEPDPRTDLAGTDVAHKLAIAATAAGFETQPLESEPLISTQLAALPIAEFWARIGEVDAAWRERARAARRQRTLLRYVGSVSAGNAEIGVRAVARDDPIAQAKGADNVVKIYSESYRRSPLVIRGPGAGATVTARALLADIVTVLHQHG
jgi:aspartate kinase